MTTLGPFIWELDFSVADKLVFPLTNWNNVQRSLLCHPGRHGIILQGREQREIRLQIDQGWDEVEGS